MWVLACSALLLEVDMEARELEKGLLGAGEEPLQQIIARDDSRNGSANVSCFPFSLLCETKTFLLSLTPDERYTSLHIPRDPAILERQPVHH